MLGADLGQGAAAYSEAIALFETLDDRRGLASSLAILAARGGSPNTETAAAAVPPSEAVAAGERAVRLARDISWRTGEAYALVRLGSCLCSQGEYGRALPLAREALAIAEEIEHRGWTAAAHYLLGTLCLDLLAISAALPHLKTAMALAGEVGSVYQRRSYAGRLASAHVVAGDLVEAEAVLDAVNACDSPMHTLGERACWWARAELALARRAPAEALSIADLLAQAARDIGGPGVTSVAHLALLRGRALAALGRLAEAEAALEAARIAATGQGFRPLHWRVDLALAALRRAARRRADAEAAARAAWIVIDGLAASVPEIELGATFRREAARLLPHPRPPSPRRAAKAAFGGLTERERHVVAHVARGMANGEIAAALSIEKRTVETHIGNALNKLGLASRGQLVAWAIEHDLGRSGR